jgi:uncharacterized protein (TIGR02145 family)
MKTIIFIRLLFTVMLSLPTIISAQTSAVNIQQTFKTILIGNQSWMAENLNVVKFRNGNPILEAKTNEEWKKAIENKQPAWCYYENDPINGQKFGKLYNWFAVNDPRGLAPKGYKIPSYNDWQKLSLTLGNDSIAGYKLKSKENWNKPRIGYKPTKYSELNNCNFNALPTGWRDLDGFYGVGNFSMFWTSSKKTLKENDDPEMPDIIYLHFEFDNIEYDDYNYNPIVGGFSIRCIKE